MAIDWGKVKTVEVEWETTDHDDNVVELTCDVECVKDCPEESDILVASDCNGKDWLKSLSDWERQGIIDKAHENIDWSTPD